MYRKFQYKVHAYIPYKQVHITLKLYVQIGFGVHNPEYLETTGPEDTVYKLSVVLPHKE